MTDTNTPPTVMGRTHEEWRNIIDDLFALVDENEVLQENLNLLKQTELTLRESNGRYLVQRDEARFALAEAHTRLSEVLTRSGWIEGEPVPDVTEPPVDGVGSEPDISDPSEVPDERYPTRQDRPLQWGIRFNGIPFGSPERDQEILKRLAAYPEEFRVASQAGSPGAPTYYWGAGPAAVAARSVGTHPVYLNYDVPTSGQTTEFGDRDVKVRLAQWSIVTNMTPGQFAQYASAFDTPERQQVLRARWETNFDEWVDNRAKKSSPDEPDWIWKYGDTQFGLLDAPSTATA